MLVEHHYSERFRWPQPGDMIRYAPRPQARPVPGLHTPVEGVRLVGRGMGARVEGEPCRLDATAMQHGPGGSLLVVAVEPGGEALHLRWAGGPTDATADCGTAAEIRVHRDGFIVLRNIADFGLPTLPVATPP